MLYFETELVPRFVLAGASLQLDFQTLADPPINACVIAFASTYRALSNNDERGPWDLRTAALQQFGQHFVQQDIAPSQDNWNSLFITNALFCILDGMDSGTTDGLPYHLGSGEALPKQKVSVTDILQPNQKLLNLMFSIFATIDVLGSIFNRRPPIFHQLSWKSFGSLPGWWGCLQVEGKFLRTMDIITDLAILGSREEDLDDAVDDLLGQINYDLASSAISAGIVRHLSTESQIDLELVTQSMRLSILSDLYLYAACKYVYRALKHLALDTPTVQKVVSRCINMLAQLAMDERLSSHALFPMIVVGSHCFREEQRNEISLVIVHASKCLAFRNIEHLDSFLKRHWSLMDRQPRPILDN